MYSIAVLFACFFLVGRSRRLQPCRQQGGPLSQILQESKAADAAEAIPTLLLPAQTRGKNSAFAAALLALSSARACTSRNHDARISRVHSSRAKVRMQIGDVVKSLLNGFQQADDISEFTSEAPSWDALRSKWDDLSTDEEKQFREELKSGRSEQASALASRRLFDLPEDESPRLTFFRDTAAWCPYCEKVWLVLEEKKVPYEVQKVNMNCYGEKPSWFWQMQPSGGIPVAKLDGNVIRESNDIIMTVERTFRDTPLLPSEDDPAYSRVQPLLRLERELFSAWFGWLTSVFEGNQRDRFEALLRRVDEELGVSGGPYFLGKDLSLVDCMFAPFLERMAASLAYYKGLTLRRNDNWPRVEEWFLAMESRPSYRHIQSDFYTHVNDLPPQIGRCSSVSEAEQLASSIDGSDGSWSLPLAEDDGSFLQPLTGLGQPEDAARREAAERLLANHEAIVRFAARGLNGQGFPPVSAPLSDPNVKIQEATLPIVDALLRHVVHALLDGPEAALAQLSSGIPADKAASILGYLRDRISVPRDMSFPAARQLRAHLNCVIDAFAAV